MLADPVQLYACGAGVRIPSLSAQKRSATSPSPGPHVKQDKAGTNATCDARNKATSGDGQPRDIVKELGDRLNFEREVVTTRCPEIITYNEAKQKILTSYTRKNRGSKKRRGQETGRCDMRGAGLRHMPCHMSTTRTFSATGSLPPVHKLQGTSRTDNGRRKSYPQAANRVAFSTSKPLLPADAVRSKWEEAIIGGISNSTARRLVHRSKGFDKLRLEGLVKEKERKIETGEEPHMISNEKSPETADTPNNDDPAHPDVDYMTEVLGGAVPIHTDHTSIVLSTNTAYSKVLQPRYPKDLRVWLGEEGAELDEKNREKLMQGYRKWSSLPIRAMTPTKMQWTAVDRHDGDSVHHAASTTDLAKDTSSTQQQLLIASQELFLKWQVHVQPQDVKLSVATKYLASVSANKQLYGLGILSQLIHKHGAIKSSDRNATMRTVAGKEREAEEGEELSGGVIAKLRALVHADTERVCVLAAILLCLLDKRDNQIEHILHQTSKKPFSPEVWAVVQCLSILGLCSPTIVKTLIEVNSFSTLPETAQQKRASELLVKLSKDSLLVHAMLAEQLNSKRWQERFATCRILPRLHRGINKDVCNRLVEIAWNDWCPEVKAAAAQALGKTGHGKLVHDEIERKLKDTSEGARLDALKKIHTLQLMTTKLLPSYLNCFKDERISVKLEAIAVAEELELRNDDVVDAVSSLMQDNSWKVKAHAIRAQGILKSCDSKVLSHLLWAVRFERLPEIRAQVCHTLAMLGVKNERIKSTLKDLLIVEEDPLVMREAEAALVHLGYGTQVEDAMADKVCLEVKRLGTQAAITSVVLTAERRNTVDYVISRGNIELSTRDYLNENTRYKYLNRRSKAKDCKGISSPTLSDEESRRIVERFHGPMDGRWSPDTELVPSLIKEWKQIMRDNETDQ